MIDDQLSAGEVGNVWSFNFFFYNRKQKRILYFACRGKTHAAASSSGEESSECAYNSDAEVYPLCFALVPRYVLDWSPRPYLLLDHVDLA